MSITQENLVNMISQNQIDKLLRYVSVTPVKLNDIAKMDILEILESLKDIEINSALFGRIARRLEAKGMEDSQIRQALLALSEASEDKRKELRTVTVSHTPAFISGLIDASRVIEQSPGRLIQAWVFSNSTADADLQLFDSPDLQNCPNNDLLLRVRCPGVALSNSESLKEEIPFISGLTAVLQGAGSSYCIEYKILEKGQGG